MRVSRWIVSAWFFAAIACVGVRTDVTVVGQARGVTLEHRHRHGTWYVDAGMHSMCGSWQTVNSHEYALLFDDAPQTKVSLRCDAPLEQASFFVDDSAMRYVLQCGASWTVYYRTRGEGLFETEAPVGFDGSRASWEDVPSRGAQAKRSLHEGTCSRAVLGALRDTSAVDAWTSLIVDACERDVRRDWYALGSLDADETAMLRTKLEASDADVHACLKALRG